MTFWIIIAVLTVVVAMFVLRPLMASGAGAARRGDYDLKVYRSQLDDLEAEVARGIIGDAEARDARNEIERRMLQAVRDEEPDIDGRGRGALIVGALLAIAVPVGAGLLYIEIGRPDLPSKPLAERADLPAGARQLAAQASGGSSGGQSENPQNLDSVERMVGSLEERLKNEPTDYEGWLLLGRSYGVMDRYGDAAAAYAKAAALPEGRSDPSAHMQMGEALIFSSGGVVPERAVEAFQRAVSIDPGHPGARYYIALSRGQAGDLKGAFDGWVALAKDSPGDAPWMPALRDRIEEVARDLGIDVPSDLPKVEEGLPPLPSVVNSGTETGGTSAPQQAQTTESTGDAPGPTAEQMQAAQSMSSDDRQAMIQGMVAGLAERLKDDRDDYDGWMRLARAYGVLGNTEGSLDAYQNAVRIRPTDIQTRLTYAGALLDAQGDGVVPDTALAQFQAIEKLDADNPDALWFLGRADAEAGRNDAALERWRRLLATQTPGSDAWNSVNAQIQKLEASVN